MTRSFTKLLLFLFLCVSSNAVADTATRLLINCVPSVSAPPGSHCFDEVIGQPFTFYVVAVDAYARLATSYTGTVHITSADPTATLPLDYTFTPANGGIAPLVMTFHSTTTTTVPSFEAVFATDAANGISGNGGFLVSPPPLPPSNVPALDAVSLLVLSIGVAVTALHTINAAMRHTKI